MVAEAKISWMQREWDMRVRAARRENKPCDCGSGLMVRLCNECAIRSQGALQRDLAQAREDAINVSILKDKDRLRLQHERDQARAALAEVRRVVAKGMNAPSGRPICMCRNINVEPRCWYCEVRRELVRAEGPGEQG
jgi:hypothetical protein